MSRTEDSAVLATRLDGLGEAVHALIQMQAEQQHSLQQREWQPFITANGGVTVSNAATITFHARAGWEWRVGRILVTCAGAAASANVVVYVNEGGVLSGTAADDISVVDFQIGFYSNSPSRAVADEKWPIYVANGAYLIVAVSGAPSGTNNVSVRIEGERREV